eukprot:SAG31_NODE_1000_length_10456_cov_3.588394_3_plen_576_part_00
MGTNPIALVGQVVDKDMITMLRTQVDVIHGMIATLAEKSEESLGNWLSINGQKEIDLCGKNEKRLMAVQVPIMDFLKAGIVAAMDQLRPKLEDIGISVRERLVNVPVTVEHRSTDMRRGLDQLLQELVVTEAKENIFPAIRLKLLDLQPASGIPFPPAVKETISNLVFDVAEGEVRKEVHKRVLKVFDDLRTSLAVVGCGVAKEPGLELKEDKYGFVKKDGGYKAFKGSSRSGSLPGLMGAHPMELVGKVLDKEMTATLKDQATLIEQFLATLKDRIQEMKKDWLEGDLNMSGDDVSDDAADTLIISNPLTLWLEDNHSAGPVTQTQQLNKQSDVSNVREAVPPSISKKDWKAATPNEQLQMADGDMKMLSKIQVPSASFITAGIDLAMEQVVAALKEVGGLRVQAKLEDIEAEISLAERIGIEKRSSFLLRALDQSLQEFVLAKSKVSVFPAIKVKLEHLTPPPGMPALPPGVIDTVSGIVFNLAEQEMRKEVHHVVRDALLAAAAELVPEGCSEMVEPGKQEPEDMYGFLQVDGGFEATAKTSITSQLIGLLVRFTHHHSDTVVVVVFVVVPI